MKVIFNFKSASMILCVCKSVSDRAIAKAIADGADSVDEISRCTRAGTGCGACREHIQAAVDMSTGRIAKPRITLPLIAALAS